MNRTIATILSCLLVITLLTPSAAFAQAAGAAPDGNDYLAMNGRDRLRTVTLLIEDARRGGVTIKQLPLEYCKKLDKFYGKNPQLKKEGLAAVLKALIVMDYDWTQRGVDKDQLARQYLGDQLYRENRARLNKN